MKFKKILRTKRENFFQKTRLISKIEPVRRYDESRATKIAAILNKISSYRPYMSSDIIRDQKIEMLQNVVYNLNRDYKSGLLFSKK